VNTLAIILARGGSQGLKNKHLLSLLNKPVITYTFDHARASRLVTRTVLTSDSEEILRLGKEAGLLTIRRPDHLATDDAAVQDVLLDALRGVEANQSFHADAVVCLYGNVPVRGDGVIDRALALLHDTGCDSVRSFCPVGKWHPAWMAELDDDRIIAHQPGSIHRRQDLEPLYLHDGAVVAVARSSLLRGLEHPEDPHAFFGVDRRAVRTTPGETVEIDQSTDFFLAEAILRHRGVTEKAPKPIAGSLGPVVTTRVKRTLRKAS
jgi:CMP-N,N'-diacetyllegionaminic acid synthase